LPSQAQHGNAFAVPSTTSSRQAFALQPFQLQALHCPAFGLLRSSYQRYALAFSVLPSNVPPSNAFTSPNISPLCFATPLPSRAMRCLAQRRSVLPRLCYAPQRLAGHRSAFAMPYAARPSYAFAMRFITQQLFALPLLCLTMRCFAFAEPGTASRCDALPLHRDYFI